jgi:hypothetical protein
MRIRQLKCEINVAHHYSHDVLVNFSEVFYLEESFFNQLIQRFCSF